MKPHLRSAYQSCPAIVAPFADVINVYSPSATLPINMARSMNSNPTLTN